MASSTRYGGDSYNENEMLDPDPPTRVVIQRAEIGIIDLKPDPDPEEEESSPENQDGGDLSPSSESDQSESESPKPSPRKPVHTTESPSKQAPEADSTASSTGGSGRKVTRKPSAKPKDEFDEFE